MCAIQKSVYNEVFEYTFVVHKNHVFKSDLYFHNLLSYNPSLTSEEEEEEGGGARRE